MIAKLAATAAHVPMEPFCLPPDAVNAMDTAKFWVTVIAGAFAVIALVIIGIGMFFQHNRGDGGEMIKKLGWWIAGCILVAAAAGITAIFLNPPTNCVPAPGLGG
ncbi:TrbC/VirB2 family protein [Agromyces neolithicus]|uniref:TrbC/VIRB2 family protein n=1 Tax=Agromyces neolithicus TaxID=269420 RepID=A0ABP4YKE5_9MICO